MGNPHPSNSIKPGQTRNPNGRPPKGTTVTELLRQKYDEEIQVVDKKTGAQLRRKRSEILAEKLYELAITKNDIKAIESIIDRVEGKPLQRTKDETPESEEVERLKNQIADLMAKINESKPTA